MTPQEFAKLQHDNLVKTEKESALFLLREFESLKRDISDYLTINLNSVKIGHVIEKSFLEKTLEELDRRIEQIRNPFTRIITRGQQKVINFASSSLKKFFGLKTKIFEPDREAIQKLIGRTQDGSTLNKAFDKLKPAVAEKAKSELIEGFEKGESHVQIATRLNKAADLGKWRAMSIARTETNEAYRAATRDFYQEADIKKYVWMAILDANTCLICWFLHGRLFKTSVKVFSHPNCRCVLMPFTGQTIRTGAEIFAKLEPGVQKQILGPGRFELYKNGAKLNDFIGTKESPEAGISHHIKSLDEVKPIAQESFRSTNDAARKYYGPGRTSDPELWEKTIDDLKAQGVRIEFTDKEMVYDAEKGNPGKIKIARDASYSALLHEKSHFDQSKAEGFPSFYYFLSDYNRFWRQEFTAYLEEIKYARKQGNFALIDDIIKEMRDRRADIRDLFNLKQFERDLPYLSEETKLKMLARQE